MSARNRIGEGPPVGARVRHDYGAPDKPYNFRPSWGNGSLTLNEVDVPTAAPPMTAWSCRSKSESGSTVASNTDGTLPWTVSSLSAGSQYPVHGSGVRANQVRRDGLLGLHHPAVSPPPAPTFTFVSVDSADAVNIRWNGPTSANGNSSLTSYVDWGDGNGSNAIGHAVGTIYERALTVPAGGTTIRTYAEGDHDQRSSTTSMSLSKPMSELNTTSSTISFTVNHQSGSSLNCTAKGPSGSNSTFTVSISEGSVPGSTHRPVGWDLADGRSPVAP